MRVKRRGRGFGLALLLGSGSRVGPGLSHNLTLTLIGSRVGVSERLELPNVLRGVAPTLPL